MILDGKMKICCISDTHGDLPEIKEEVDLLIHAGDICPNKYGPKERLLDAYIQVDWIDDFYISWLKTLKAKKIVQIWGNHDFIEEVIHDKIKWPKNVIHLNDNKKYYKKKKIIIDDREIVVWGCPWSAHFFNWAFNAPKGDYAEEFLGNIYKSITDEVDIIVSHSPPKGYGDKCPDGYLAGSNKLLKKFKEIDNCKLLVTGHVHGGQGVYDLYEGLENKRIVNASVLNEDYRLVNKPIFIDF